MGNHRACCVLEKVSNLADFLQLMTDEKKYTAKQVAELLGANRATISAWCRDGKFKNAKKVESPTGDYWLIPEGDLKDVEIKMGRPKKKN